MARCDIQLKEVTDLVNKKSEEVIALLSNKSLKEAKRLAPIMNDRHFYGARVIQVPKALGTTPVVIADKAMLAEAIENKITDDEKYEMEERMAELEAGQNYATLDMLPSGMKTYNKFNYSNVLNNKIILKAKLEAQRNLIKNKKRDKQQLRQVEYLNNTIKKLAQDIKHLRTADESLEVYLNSVARDVRNVKALLKNPTIDNIQAIGTYIEVLENITKKSGSEGNGFLMDDIDTIEEDNPIIFEQLKETIDEINLLRQKQNIAQERMTRELIRNYLKNTKGANNWDELDLDDAVEAHYKEQFESNREMAMGLQYVTGMDEQEKKNIIVSAIYKTYADALTQSNMKDKRKALDDIKDEVKAELIKLGHSTGRMFRKVANQNIFLRKNTSAHQLIGKFSSAWVAFQNKMKTENERITQNILYDPKKTSDEVELIKKTFQKLDANVDFFDVTLVPEIIEDDTLQHHKEFFGDIKEAEAYRDKLVAKIGQREYDKLKDDAMQKIFSYDIFLEQQEARLLERREQAKNNPKIPWNEETHVNRDLHYSYSKNPFIFAKTYKDTGSNQINKHYTVNGEKKFTNTPADMEFISYSPKHESYFDQDFKEIENNPVLNKAWGIMADLVEFNNQNGFNNSPNDLNEYSLAAMQKKLKQMPLSKLKLMGRKVLSHLHKNVTAEREMDENIDNQSNQVSGSRNLVDKQIKQLYKSKIAQYTKPDKKTKETVMQEAKAQILERQNPDLMDNILTATRMTEVFKAKREVEAEVLFLRNQLQKVKDRAAFKKITDFFINKEFYGINNRQHWGWLNVPPVEGRARWFSEHEKDIRTESKASIKALQERLKTETDDMIRADIQREIAAFEEFLESGGRVLTGGSVVEAILIKSTRVVAFSVNFGAQATNKVIADVNAWEVDGREGFWSAGAYHDSKSFSRKWKEYGGNLETKRQIKIGDLLLQRLEVFQNSSNEIFKLEKSKAKNALLAILENPMNLVSEVEKTIQRPQILAMLSEIDIQGVDANGNPITVKMWDRKTRSFPAFTEVDGALELAEGFKSKENIDTYLLNNSQEYSNLFGDAGTIPRNIAFINGDYRETSTYLFEKNMLTALAMLFKRWSVATVKKKLSMYQRLGENKSGDLATIATAMKGGTVMLASGTLLGPIGGIIGLSLYGASVGRRVYKAKLKADKIKATEAGMHLKNTQVTWYKRKGFVKRQMVASARLSMAASATALSMIISPFTKKQYINSDKIKRIMDVRGLNELDGTEVTDKEIRQIEDDLYFLTTSVASTLKFLAMRALVMLALYPGEDEEKEHKERVARGDLFWSRMAADPDTALYYTLENMFSGFIQDANMLFNINGLVREGDVFGAKKLGIMANDLESIAQGNAELKSGENKGKNRFWTHLFKYYTPAAMKDGMSMGFGSKSKRDYNTQNWIDQLKRPKIEKINSARLEAREKHKKALEESSLWSNMTEKQRNLQISRELSKMFPVVRDEDMYDDGFPDINKRWKWKDYYDDGYGN
jgi:hypothetical protein